MRYTTNDGMMIGLDRFGASAPASELFAQFGFRLGQSIWYDFITRDLEDEGVQKFADSYRKAIASIERKASLLVSAQ
jgi:hypothetical protein